MKNGLKIKFAQKEIESIELNYKPGKSLKINLEVCSDDPVQLNALSKEEWIIISTKHISADSKCTILSIKFSPSEKEELFSGNIELYNKNSEELLLNLPVKLIKYNEIPDRKETTAVHILDKTDKFHCKQCGKEVPDKRPLCTECRKKQNEDIKQQEEDAEKEKISENLKKINKWLLPSSVLVALIVIILILYGHHITTSKQGFGNLYITSDPPGANVISLDNKFPDGITPLKRESLSSGVYKFSLSKENCGGSNEIVSVEVKPNNTTTYHAPLPKKGSVSLNSIPQGASILIDDISFDKKTPVKICDLDIGERKITFVYNETNTKTVSALVKWGEETQVYSLADDTMAGLALKIPDGIKIKINGKITGTSPVPVMLLKPGRHTLSFSAESIIPWTTKVTLTKGDIAALEPSIIYMGELEIKSDRPSDLYIDNQFMGVLPQTVYAPPGKKILITAVAHDGAEWTKAFIMKEGQFRRVSIVLPEPPLLGQENNAHYTGGDMVYSQPGSGSFLPPKKAEKPEPPADFSQFQQNSRFPPSQWQKQDEITTDIDLDGESEKIIAFKNLSVKGSKGYRLELFIIKKHHGEFFDVIPLRNPRLGGIGEGELISLDIIKSDKYGYRDIAYTTGTASGGIANRGSFTIYKNRAYSPSHKESK